MMRLMEAVLIRPSQRLAWFISRFKPCGSEMNALPGVAVVVLLLVAVPLVLDTRLRAVEVGRLVEVDED